MKSLHIIDKGGQTTPDGRVTTGGQQSPDDTRSRLRKSREQPRQPLNSRGARLQRYAGCVGQDDQVLASAVKHLDKLGQKRRARLLLVEGKGLTYPSPGML